ncbi:MULTISPECIES: hypothetical protein [Rhodococcus]|uniref:Uncharacterized protein n=1 Tax=Rhodococcus opacus (strain B4) TaxID=632772 RepID=C1BBU3_RHOOB|nr:MULTISPECIES: hypothetical protein [Rhodococcus]KAF0957027.1 hypothetical protein MLGJGCBP_10107 [Rhodococcus sp. T7]KAF0965325.1 hypothetical protein MLGJGCBP_01527 [Rhodococcus sp. T7]QQZ18685.1 hypothetical protein GO592_41935 [Rhodococcus sp. 21391]UOT07838.1 hypothetical protein MPY17_36105 [Rhodococcus opacus]BAH55525.1 hypothetical protein ROP_pROB01-00260 [Rhodococcus opacus B4]
MSKKDGPVPRPIKRVEWHLVFATRDAAKGWTDLLATARNATVDAWDTLTREPIVETSRLYQLKGDYAYGTYQGRTYARYQYKVTDGGRIWFFVDPAPKGAKNAGRVLLERCEPGHPKETE